MTEELKSEKKFERKQFLINLIIMIVFGVLILLPLILYGYHFFI